MLYVERIIEKNIYDLPQRFTIYRGNNFKEAEEIMKKDKSGHRIEIWSSVTMDLIAFKEKGF